MMQRERGGSAISHMNVFALDFDGVLCDSAAEAGVTAWRAGSRIWPQWRGLEPPADYLRRFVKLRPVIETGYQTVLLMKLIHDDLSDDCIMAEFLERCEALLGELGWTRKQCGRLFNQIRTEWMQQNLEDWLSRHRFYPQVWKTFTEHLASEPIFIVTTKQERFVEALLDAAGIAFPIERIFGLDKGQAKEAVLVQLLQGSEFRHAHWHFVEDRLKTLLRIVECESLRRVRLYLAAWGYNTAKDRSMARRLPFVTLWNPEQFLVV
jgi:phosphoglycolate phosphatase-like HAD superfamily hydrolase